MKKAMRISGNFVQFGKWSEPEPGFEGYIVIDEDGVGRFDGYLNELSLEEVDRMPSDLEEKIEKLTQEVVRVRAINRRLYDCDGECLRMLRDAE